jgi:mannose-6-phosphate isomerase-like protein (cupin superfamily)
MSEPTSDHTAKRIDELEASWGGSFIRARASLGVTSFGMNIVNLPPSSGEMYPEHSHRFNGQEEVYYALSGSADLVLPDGVVPLDPGGSMVRVGPESRRAVRSGPEGVQLLVIGGVLGKAYTPQPNSVSGAPETLDTLAPDAASSMIPGTTPNLTARGRY